MKSFNKTVISLDYDDTYTKDPDLWQAFITLCKSRDIEVVCVTFRYESETFDMDPRLTERIRVFPTGRRSKKEFMQEQGIEVSIWIDDMPEFIVPGIPFSATTPEGTLKQNGVEFKQA